MAIYHGPERRRRASVALAVGALVAGVLIGLAIGRATAPSLDDQIAEGRAAGRDVVAALRVLPLEYRQAAAGSSETSLIGDTVKRATRQLPAALEKAPWLSGAQRRTANGAAAAIEAAARAKVAPARFDAVTARSTATLQSIFGLPASSAG
jgi:hypothetical protein